ncbi:DUF3800 domain-containing protein [Paenibacillus sp. BGI2013]|uniref:DUF3800 domain-containing protein n=1 Tax=Paenibacillus sp. BGI2013 TaxID=2058902 RepID=UPI0015D5B140|nr:DUF3800 domain-containing protein [Paenibacillus sp. BGI2013]
MINGFYLDESGNNGFKDMKKQPVVCYGGILVPNANVIKLERDFEALSFKAALHIKGEIKGLTIKQVNTLPFFQKYEIHSKSFFDGDDLYSKIPMIDRFKLAEEMLELIDKHGGKVIASVINKNTYKQNTGDTGHTNMHQLGMSNLIQLIEKELIQRNETGIVIPDEGRDDERELLIQVIRQETTSDRIYYSSFLQNSHHCQLVQLADIIVFLTTIFFRYEYGYAPRKANNKELINLYQKKIAPLSPTVWEYR